MRNQCLSTNSEIASLPKKGKESVTGVIKGFTTTHSTFSKVKK